MPAKLRSPFLKSPRRALLLGTASLALFCSSLVHAESSEKDSEDPEKGAFSALDILPEGSILRRVRLPRYDENFAPTSLLTAETLTVLDKDRIDGLDISIELYAKDGSLDARTKMRRAIYNQKLSTLEASEAIFIEGKSYVANGTGLIFDWKSNRGFLLGPASTKFQRTTPPKSITMNTSTSPAPRLAVQSLVMLTSMSTALIAEPPAKLTSEQIAEFEHLKQPLKHSIEQQQQEIRSRLHEDTRLNDEANAAMIPFLVSIGQNLPVQSQASDTQKVTSEPTTGNKPTPKKAPPKKGKEPKVETLKVTCDGGLYFDTDTGVLAYLKNIRLTESSFTLTCSDELKVFLEKKQPKEKAKDSKTKKKESKEEQPKEEQPKGEQPEPVTNPKKADNNHPTKKKDDSKKDDAFSNFGELKRIIATGKVKITRKDEKGQVFIATAESASYDAKTGEMILRGGLPRLQLSANQYLQSLAPGQYIRILSNGKFITEGKWRMETPTKFDKKP